MTDIRTAELAKHASNAFLALKISFANALARVCEAAGGRRHRHGQRDGVRSTGTRS